MRLLRRFWLSSRRRALRKESRARARKRRRTPRRTLLLLLLVLRALAVTLMRVHQQAHPRQPRHRTGCHRCLHRMPTQQTPMQMRSLLLMMTHRLAVLARLSRPHVRSGARSAQPQKRHGGAAAAAVARAAALPAVMTHPIVFRRAAAALMQRLRWKMLPLSLRLATTPDRRLPIRLAMPTTSLLQA
jgi:hypothetical protein